MVRERETRIVGDCVAELKRIAGGKFWRNNTGVARMPGRDAPVTFGEPGAGDILGALHGRPVAIECKTATGRQSQLQKLWQADWEAAGGLYLLVRSATDMLEQLGRSFPSITRAVPNRVIHR